MEQINYLMSIMPSLMEGAKITIQVFAFTIVGALPFGLIIALMSITKFYPIKAISKVYVWIFRERLCYCNYILFITVCPI